MTVEFRRTGQRRYAVRVTPAGLPALVMEPAPGFDDALPHDMVHLVVEAVLDLHHGLYGRLAAGEDAGSFRLDLASAPANDRDRTRARRRIQRKGSATLGNHRDDALSELAAAHFDILWRARRNGQPPPPEVVRDQARQMAGLTPAESARFARAEPQIVEVFDRLSARWRTTEPGSSMTVIWPDLALERTLS